MKILVTGGTTFVSRYTAEHFAENGHEVYVLNRNSRQQPNGTRLIEGDRHDLGDILRGVHFDAVLDITAYTRDDIRGLINSGVLFDDYVFISSSAVYPETNRQPFTEDQPCGQNSVWGEYGVNKLGAEEYLKTYVPDAYILRPPYFYGIYENLYREAFPFDCAESGRPFYIPGDGEMKLQFFNVSDLCRFIEILLESHPSDHVFNVGNKETVSVREWVELCYKAAGKKAQLKSVKRNVQQRDYFCFYDYEYVLDVSKQTALMPQTMPLKEGLRIEYEWYKDHPESVYYKKPYIEFIDSVLTEK